MKVQGSTVLLTSANGSIGRAFVNELLNRGVARLYVGVASFSGPLTAVDLATARLEMAVNYFGPMQMSLALRAGRGRQPGRHRTDWAFNRSLRFA
ncbi:hypothetical protein [Martelella alba]|uniref:Short chain dehydrogenase n=1 Tax=Martelella alba TaxID=2590451 RepID=A0ABY2SQS6_9HYPH|nr:hypothetical protein [Martelella alba]TKI08536.1 hypothetical protein FCN80_00280 [Martelella alba]